MCVYVRKKSHMALCDNKKPNLNFAVHNSLLSLTLVSAFHHLHLLLLLESDYSERNGKEIKKTLPN